MLYLFITIGYLAVQPSRECCDFYDEIVLIVRTDKFMSDRAVKQASKPKQNQVPSAAVIGCSLGPYCFWYMD